MCGTCTGDFDDNFESFLCVGPVLETLRILQISCVGPCAGDFANFENFLCVGPTRDFENFYISCAWALYWRF